MTLKIEGKPTSPTMTVNRARQFRAETKTVSALKQLETIQVMAAGDVHLDPLLRGLRQRLNGILADIQHARRQPLLEALVDTRRVLRRQRARSE
jgi:hypothetical protein